MKKLNLSIPTPCHENWEQMSQAEKGKFCGACQKTVVDFTAMSDRQLADFFKKPKDNVCGRFNNDQLEREIFIPRKRIPWIKYFFQFTWPAFVLGLKSCSHPTNPKLKGEEQIVFKTPAEIKTIRLATMGFTVSKVFPYEKPDVTETIPEPIRCFGDDIADTTEKPVITTFNEEDSVRSYAPMEPVTIHSYQTMGKISIVSACGRSDEIENIEEDSSSKNIKTEFREEKFLAYPNPVNAGSTMTVKFPENSIPEKIQLISISGQLIASIEQDISNYATMCNISVPSQIASGVYFLRLIGKNKILNTTKIVVN